MIKTLEDECEKDFKIEKIIRSNPVNHKIEKSLEYSFENYFREDSMKPF